MRDDDGRGAQIDVNAFFDFEHQLACCVVERAGWRVAQQDVGALDDGAGNGDALLLAARQLGRKMVTARSQAHHGDGIVDRHRFGCDVGDQRDVLEHGQAGDQIVELEDEADMTAAIGGQLRFAGGAQILGAEQDLAGRCSVEPPENVEQRRFSTA